MGREFHLVSTELDKARLKELSIVTKEEWKEYTKSVWQIANVSHPEHPAVFPEEIPHRLTKLFSFWGETVLDPFGGTGVTAVAATKLGRHAMLIDQNARYIEIAKDYLLEMTDQDGECDARVGDSRHMTWIEDESIGLIVTSPPYWDKADYGDGESNLGNVASYAGFIESLRPTFQECFRVLTPGRKLCVVTANVSQHTDHGLLSFPLATDILNVLREIGFLLTVEVIWNKNGTGGRWGSAGAQRPIFGSYPYPPNFLFKTVHEYILVVSKPSTVRKKGPKVKALEGLIK